MREIRDIAEDIREEIDGAKHYAELAVKMKGTMFAETYADMARQELGHVDKLHSMAVQMINEQRAKGVTPPAAMQAVWDWEHERMIDRVAHIKHILDMVK
ncbi:MAG: hypothetical protein IKZ36_02330 [Kiritimatiellae bacterium]|nr:hypothetical protein [Kiritimatiellia bacterium]